MAPAKRSNRKKGHARIGKLKTRDLPSPEQKRVKGGRTPTPAGPIPVPYPNVRPK